MARTFVNGKELIPNENGKITLPKELQVEMLKFFMRTSIPRAKRKKMEEQARLVNLVKAIYDMRAQNSGSCTESVKMVAKDEPEV